MHPDDLQKISENNIDIDTKALGMIIRLLEALEPFSDEVLYEDVMKPDKTEICPEIKMKDLKKAKEVYSQITNFLVCENIVDKDEEKGLDWP